MFLWLSLIAQPFPGGEESLEAEQTESLVSCGQESTILKTSDDRIMIHPRNLT